MELTKEIAQMICDLEYRRIGVCWYGPHSTDGCTRGIGKEFRFSIIHIKMIA